MVYWQVVREYTGDMQLSKQEVEGSQASLVTRVTMGGGYSFVAHHLTTDHTSLSRRSTVPTPNRDTSNIWALVTLLPYNRLTTKKCLSCLLPIFCRQWPPSISSISSIGDRFLDIVISNVPH